MAESTLCPQTDPDGKSDPTQRDRDMLERSVKLCDIVLNGSKSKHYSWFKEVDKLISDVQIPFNMITPVNSLGIGSYVSYMRIAPELLSLLRDCLLHCRYEEALEYLKIIVKHIRLKLDLAVEGSLHRGALEILYRLSDRISNVPVIDYTIQLQKLNKTINPQQIVIESFIYCVTSGRDIREAMECITQLPKIHKHMSELQKIKVVNNLHTAYRGVASYIQWEQMNRQQSSQAVDLLPGFGYSQTIRVNESAEDALTDLATFNLTKGKWDLFVHLQIRIYVHMRRFNEAEEVLQDYKSANEDNPTAHRMLIDFLDQWQPHSIKTRKKALRDYCRRWKCDKVFTCKLIGLLQTEMNAATLVEITELYLSLLDYPNHRSDLDLWEDVEDFLKVAVDVDSAKSAIGQMWSERRSWWVPFHFTQRNSADAHCRLAKVKRQVHRLLDKTMSGMCTPP